MERQRAGSCLASCHHGSYLFIAGDSEAVCVFVVPVDGPTPSRYVLDALLSRLVSEVEAQGPGLNFLMLVWMKFPALLVVEISVTRLHSTSPPRLERERKRAGSVPNLFLSPRLAESAPLERLCSCRGLTCNYSRGLKVIVKSGGYKE